MRHDRRPAGVVGLHAECPAELLRSLAHRGQADACRHRPHPVPIVDDADREDIAGDPEADPDGGSTAVPGGVREALEGDPEGGDLDGGRQRREGVRRIERARITRPVGSPSSNAAMCWRSAPTRPTSSRAGGRRLWAIRRTSSIIPASRSPGRQGARRPGLDRFSAACVPRRPSSSSPPRPPRARRGGLDEVGVAPPRERDERLARAPQVGRQRTASTAGAAWRARSASSRSSAALKASLGPRGQSARCPTGRPR